MAATAKQIREAIAAQITTVIGTSWQVNAYYRSMPQAPAIDIRPSHIDYDAAMDRGGDELQFTIRAMAAFNVDQGAQMKLDELLDTTSATGMKAIVQADTTLGGLVDDLRLLTASDYLQIAGVEGNPDLLAIEFVLQVLV